MADVTGDVYVIIDPQTLDLRIPTQQLRFTAEQWAGIVMPPCPVCGTTIDVDRVDTTMMRDDERRYILGRWKCPNGCDPRANR